MTVLESWMLEETDAQYKTRRDSAFHGGAGVQDSVGSVALLMKFAAANE